MALITMIAARVQKPTQLPTQPKGQGRHESRSCKKGPAANLRSTNTILNAQLYGIEVELEHQEVRRHVLLRQIISEALGAGDTTRPRNADAQCTKLGCYAYVMTF